MRKIFQQIGKLMEYLVALFFVGIFALYCSGRVGWFLVLVLVLTPLLSMIYAVFSARFLEITGEVNGQIYSKGDHLLLKLTIVNRGWLPSAFLRMELLENSHWKTENRQLMLAVAPKSREGIQISYQAQYAGGSEIGVEKICVCDFLGLLAIPIKEEHKLRWRVGVIPEIQGVSMIEDFLKEVLQEMSGQSESEETIDASTDTFGGFPGYEYRTYRPGDPIKRINYKLSAKKDELWVRLDEKQAISTVYLMLDPYYVHEGEGAIEIQHTLEVMLGITQSLLLHDFVVEVWFKGDEGIEYQAISGEEQIVNLAKILALYQFESVRRPMELPAQIEQDGNSMIYVTPYGDRELLMEIEQIRKARSVNIKLFRMDEGGDIAC